MPTRLEAVAPEIEAELRSFSPAQCATLAMQIAAWAIEQTCPEDSQLRDVAASGDKALVRAVSNSFDEDYFATQETDPAESLRNFCCARAAGSLAFALENNLSDTIYEAIIATDDVSTVHQFVNHGAL